MDALEILNDELEDLDESVATWAERRRVMVRRARDDLGALIHAANAVVWFDWSSNDDDAFKSIEALREALAKFTKAPTNDR